MFTPTMRVSGSLKRAYEATLGSSLQLKDLEENELLSFCA